MAGIGSGVGVVWSGGLLGREAGSRDAQIRSVRHAESQGFLEGRGVYEFDPVTATGIRIVSTDDGRAYWELEVYEYSPISVIEEGGMPESGVTSGLINVAFASRGGIPFAYDTLGGDYDVPGLNDGSVYDLGSVWIGAGTWDDDTFIGVALRKDV